MEDRNVMLEIVSDVLFDNIGILTPDSIRPVAEEIVDALLKEDYYDEQDEAQDEEDIYDYSMEIL